MSGLGGAAASVGTCKHVHKQQGSEMRLRLAA